MIAISIILLIFFYIFEKSIGQSIGSLRPIPISVPIPKKGRYWPIPILRHITRIIIHSFRTSCTQKSCLAESSIRRHLRKNYYMSIDNRSLFEVISRISSEQIIRVSTLYRLNSVFRRFLRHSLQTIYTVRCIARLIARSICRCISYAFTRIRLIALFVQFRFVCSAC